MPVSISAALAIQTAAKEALSNVPSSYLAPYMPKGPTYARSAGALAWMKAGNKMADLLALVSLCDTLESLMGDPRAMQALVDKVNADTLTRETLPLTNAQAAYNNAANPDYLAALNGAVKTKMATDLELAKKTDPELAKAAIEARKDRNTTAFDALRKGVKSRPGASPTNPTVFGRG